jgi:Domain of unknown function (DUF4160)
MVAIIRQGGLAFVIFKDDHPPAHVHVFGDGQARFWLKGVDGFPELDRAFGLSAGDIRKAMRVIQERRIYMLERWKEIHGGTD